MKENKNLYFTDEKDGRYKIRYYDGYKKSLDSKPIVSFRNIGTLELGTRDQALAYNSEEGLYLRKAEAQRKARAKIAELPPDLTPQLRKERADEIKKNQYVASTDKDIIEVIQNSFGSVFSGRDLTYVFKPYYLKVATKYLPTTFAGINLNSIWKFKSDVGHLEGLVRSINANMKEKAEQYYPEDKDHSYACIDNFNHSVTITELKDAVIKVRCEAENTYKDKLIKLGVYDKLLSLITEDKLVTPYKKYLDSLISEATYEAILKKIASMNVELHKEVAEREILKKFVYGLSQYFDKYGKNFLSLKEMKDLANATRVFNDMVAYTIEKEAESYQDNSPTYGNKDF